MDIGVGNVELWFTVGGACKDIREALTSQLDAAGIPLVPDYKDILVQCVTAGRCALLSQDPETRPLALTHTYYIPAFCPEFKCTVTFNTTGMGFCRNHIG